MTDLATSSLPRRVILPIDSFKEALPVLDTLDGAAAVLFDVDRVISIPAEPLLHPHSFRQHHKVVEEVLKPFSREQRVVFKHLVVARPCQLVERDLPALIKTLQKKAILTLGFTNAIPGVVHENLGHFHDVRERRLKEVDVDFSTANVADQTFSDLNPVKGSHPSLIHGILYACGSRNTKGAVLARFLRDHPEIHTIVRFEDDNEHLLSETESVEKGFPQVNFVGFLYKGAEAMTCAAQDEQRMRSQLNQLLAEVKDCHD